MRRSRTVPGARRGKVRIGAAGAIAAVALATTFLAAPSASAAGANWSGWSGSCFGWTTWDANHVTGHTWDHSYDTCKITIYQWDSARPNQGSSNSGYIAAPDQGAKTDTYWHGFASSGGRLEDNVCVEDLSTGAAPACSGWVYN
ncbi:hypothetical protein ACFH04_10805 [Streptomyces noboritoensis]|uniref:Secreted protein n=1 Tax=Streptomyces noboritoensis TaxID=67337 RepID=A0ABV6TEJ3_9ACTN